MKEIDPELVIYTIGGIILVAATFIVLSLFTEGVKTINSKVQESEKKAKEKERERRSKAA
jgi:hypothetical protein